MLELVIPQIILSLLALLPVAEPPPSEAAAVLVDTIASLDRELFDAYNRCDPVTFAGFFVDEVEFYHDRSGLAVGKESLIESLRKNICGKVRRELVPGTLVVYPMDGYGALEMGIHLFHHPGREATEPPGQGKFVHLWQNKEGAWKITRVISYDHRALEK